MPYHGNAELDRLVQQYAAAANSRACIAEVGRTVEGRLIRAVHLAAPGRTLDRQRPQALVTANIHGTEVIGSEVALAILALLSAPEPDEPALELLSLADVTVVAAVNLDARERAAGALCAGRPWASAPRGNRHGVDLNRNFPYPAMARDVWHPLAGTRYRIFPWYRGPTVASEPETRAVMSLAEALRPRAALNLHSVGRLFLYPYCCSPESPRDLPHFCAMGEAFVRAQQGEPYRIRQSRTWYAILGDMDDWLYDRFGTLAVTVELARPLAGVGRNPARLFSQLSWMNPREPEPTIADAAVACLKALAEGIRRAAAQNV